jgi:hypothetical protein
MWHELQVISSITIIFLLQSVILAVLDDTHLFAPICNNIIAHLLDMFNSKMGLNVIY